MSEIICFISKQHDILFFKPTLCDNVTNTTCCHGVSRWILKVRHRFSRTYVDAAGCPFTWTGIVVDLILKILNIFYQGQAQAQPGFWSQSSLHEVQVFRKYSTFWPKNHMVNLNSKRTFRSFEVVTRPKSWMPEENLNSMQTGLSLKIRLALTWPWPYQNFKFLF